jgi:hypothetical protein
MDTLTPQEVQQIVSESKLTAKYNVEVDSESAYEILTEKLNDASQKEEEDDDNEPTKTARGRAKKEEGFFDNPMVKQVGRTAAGIITRSLLGALGLGGRTRSSRKKTSWF